MWGVVVPTIRPEKYQEFLYHWTPLFSKHDVRLYTVWDLDGFPLEGPNLYPSIRSHRGMRPDFIPQGTDMCRSWGFYQAYKDGVDFTLSLDDDVSPAGRDPFAEYEKEFARQRPHSPYFDVGAFSMGSPMRGFPYQNRHVDTVVQYGGWKGVPDLDAVTQLGLPPQDADFADINIAIPHGVPLTTCAMNFAFRTSYTPIMWQLPLYEGKYNRFGDIWSGLIQKRVLDALGLNMVLNGAASVIHDRASDPYANLRREAVGLQLNEYIWESMEYLDPSEYMKNLFIQATYKVWKVMKDDDPAAANHFAHARNEWLALFS